MMKFLKKYSYALYLGGILGICGIYLWDWRYWVITIPMIILVVWREN